MQRKSNIVAALCAASLAFTPTTRAADAESVEELRNTVINILEALVQKGVLTREQANAMVADAQAKAAAQAKEKAAQEAAEKDAVRVTYVPEVVKEQIRDEVRFELRPEVTKDVIAQAKAEKWGVPGAMPPWVSKLNIYGDLRVRGESDNFASDNAQNAYLDFQTINTRGGIGKAGTAALLNTTEDRERLRLRLRLGLNAQVTDGVMAGIRLATGSLTDPVSTNQTLGQSGQRYQFSVDQAYLRFDTNRYAEVPWMTIWAGRLPNPWFSSDLVWDPDLQFEGLATTWRLDYGGSQKKPRHFFFTVGAFPLQEIELSKNDKWLYAGQLGVDWNWNSGVHTRFGAAYYYYDHITGIRNAPDSTLLDYTAPQFLQKGNTLFDIRNDTDPTTNLFALAADYHLVNATFGLDAPAFGHLILFNADWVKNIGYDEQKVFARTGQYIAPRPRGYQFEFGGGTVGTGRTGNWRAAIEYRYLERDAVVDAFTDSDFHLGGTDAKGYVLKGDWWFRDNTFLSVRYLSSNEIDGPPLGIDTLFLDVTGTF